MNTRKEKVWGGLTFVKGKQHRTLVCAKTKKRAIELIKNINPRHSLNEFNNYWAETGNPVELAVAQTEGIYRNNIPISDPGNHTKIENFEKIKGNN